jgi:hypothetical protein
VRVLTLLKDIHAELREAIKALEVAVSGPTPDRETLSAARLRLTRLSSRRRTMIEGSILPLLRDLSPDQEQRIADLRLETARLVAESSKHIGHWTMRTICADWEGYQRASALMRRSMIRRIQQEAAVLYPLLEAKEAQQAA